MPTIVCSRPTESLLPISGDTAGAEAMHPPLQKMYKRKEKKQGIKNDRALDEIVSRALSVLCKVIMFDPKGAFVLLAYSVKKIRSDFAK